MSSEYQPSGPLFSDNGAHVSPFASSPNNIKLTEAATGTAETYDASPRLRFNSLTLDELSEELDRRTKETQRLQDEVENATKLTLERFGCTYGVHCSPVHRSHDHRFNFYDSPRNSTALSSCQQAGTQPLVCDLDGLNQGVAQKNMSSLEEDGFENAIDGCLQQLSDLQLSQTHGQAKQGTFEFDRDIINLQTELHKVQMEKDVLSDLRLKDSRKHVEQMEKMLRILEELQNLKRVEGQKTKAEALAETLEPNVKEMHSSLLDQEKQCGDGTNYKATASSRQLATRLTEEFNEETDSLQGRFFSSVQKQGNEEFREKNEQKERMEDLIASLDQEMALLTDKLSSSKNNGVSLRAKFELLKKLAERQASLHQGQVRELVSTLSSYKDKVCCLEQQLVQAQSQLVDAQREREQSLYQAEALQSQLGQLKRCSVQQQSDLQEEVHALRGQLDDVREQLFRGGEEKTCLRALLEQRTQEGRKCQELLEEKNKDVQFKQQEVQQHFSKLQEAERQCRSLHADRETLRLKLDDQERTVDILRLQSCTVDNVHQENSLLSNQLNQRKLEIQQLKAQLEQHKSDLAAAEVKRRALQASVAQQSQRVCEGNLEKQQLTTQLELQRMELLKLKQEHRRLQQLHSCKKEEHEGVVLKLQSRLRSALLELDQIRTLEGANGHGLRAAIDLQEKITARRVQIDFLQGKIQHLEETMEMLRQEKRIQSLEHQCQLQKLTFAKEEKRKLSNELEDLRSKDKDLRDWIGQLEGIFHKISESFAECQNFIQLQTQGFFRLKLQHALDVKPKRQQESPAQELRSLVKEMRVEISENLGPHTDNNAADSSFHRRRSAPERLHKTTFCTDKGEDIKAGSGPPLLKTTELNQKMTVNKSFIENLVLSSPATASMYTSYLKLLPLGRRSPVHFLLTSDQKNQH